MKNILIIILGVILTLINNYLGHYHPPFSIDWTPLLIGFLTVLIFYLTDFKLIFKYLLLIGLIILNDILIKYFAGGIHDWEGVDWIMAFLFFGLIIALIILIIYGFTKEKKRKKRHFIFLLISGVLIFGYASTFDSLGMTWTNSSSKNIESSKEKGLFISNAVLSDSLVIFDTDTFLIRRAWIEKQTKTNHKGLFKKIIKTNKNYCNLEFNGDFKQKSFENDIYYKLDDNKSIGYQYLGQRITLEFDNNLESYKLGFYDKDMIRFKEIEIKNGH